MKKSLVFHFFGLLFIIAGNAAGQDNNSSLIQAGDFFNQGYFTKAAILYDKCLPDAKPANNSFDTSYLKQFELAGRCFRLSGQYQKALLVFEALKRIHSESKKSDSAMYASDLNDIAECYYSMGKYDTALLIFEESRNIRLRHLGSHHPDFAESIDNIAVLFCEVGKYTDALPLLEEAKLIRTEILGTEHLDYAKSLDNLGSYYYTIGDYKTALPLYEQAVSIYFRIVGNMHPFYAKSLNNLAALYYAIGKYDSALSLYLDASAIDKEKLGNKHLDYGIELNNLAMLYKKKGNYEAALPLLKEFSSICKETVGTIHPYYASSLMNLGGMYSALGIYDSAVSCFLEAKEIRKAQLGSTHADYARVLNSLAVVYKKMCNYEAALVLYKEALAIYSAVFGKKHEEYARSLNNLANLYIKLGKYESALPLYEEAIIINKQELGLKHTEYAYSLNNLGMLYSDMGNYNEALRLLKEAASIDSLSLGTETPEYAVDLNNLANQYAAIGNYKDAMVKLHQASAIRKAKFGEKNQQYALSLSSLGRLYKSMGNYDSALPYFINASAIFKEVLGVKNADYAMSLRNMAINYKEMGEYDVSLPLLWEASAVYKEIFGTNHPDYINCIYNIAGIYIARKEYTKGLPLMEEANASFKNRIQDYFSFLPEGEKKIYMENIRYFYDDYLSGMMSVYESLPVFCSYGYDNALFIKGVILSSVTSMQQSILESGDSVLISKYEQMRMLKRQINSWQQRPISERQVDLAKLEQRSLELEKDITRQSKVFSEMQSVFKIKWRDVQKQLNDKEAAIEFVSFREYENGKKTDSIYYYAFVLRKSDSIPQVKYLCEESGLKEIIPALGTKTRGIDSFYNERDIYNLAWKPIDSLLEGIITVYFAPTGLLNSVAMAAISCPDSTKLLEKYQLIQLSSTRTLALAGKPEPIKTAVVYGGISYDADSLTLLSKAGKYSKEGRSFVAHSRSVTDTRSGFRYLPGTLKEAEMVSSKLEKKKISPLFFSGSDAVEESFIALSGINAPSVIHLSTHGFYFPDIDPDKISSQGSVSNTEEARLRYASDPLQRSGLLLAGANLSWKGLAIPPDVEDGILTAKEVSNMNLMNTQLVVLSACQTGQGDVKGNEGVEGLQRGFKMAGVRYLVMSLWEVPDKETTEFMDKFYTNWLDSNDIHEAFRATQLTMNQKYRNEPFKWAAFVLVE